MVTEMPPPRSVQKADSASPRAAKPHRALMSLRDSFSLSGRHLLRRILPFLAQEKAVLPDRDSGSLYELAMALLSVRGEASGVAIATDLLSLYEQSDDLVRNEFFDILSTRFNPDPQSLAESWERYTAQGQIALPDLARAVESPRQELFRRLNLAPGGTAALVRMRTDLLSAKNANASLGPVDADLSHLLQSWFNRGFLTMRSIDWSSPASLLERIIRYEAVHHINSWAELRSRLDPEDRRCFAFFHPAMPEEPLIFVEVGLTLDIPDNIQAILESGRTPNASSAATTATFYSISNCQPGLRGISFGHFLIKQVAADLKRELPNLTCFVTLSPVPGLVDWIRAKSLSDSEKLLLDHLTTPDGLTDTDEPAARVFLLEQAVTYFTAARNGAGKPRDSVARFHLGNGARLERLNWRGDISPNGLRQSGGLMVNYLYDLSRIEENHEAFVERGEVVTGAAFGKVAKAVATGGLVRRGHYG